MKKGKLLTLASLALSLSLATPAFASENKDYVTAPQDVNPNENYGTVYESIQPMILS